MNVGIIGSGGREHALCYKLRHSSEVKKLYCIPGNAGTKNIAENIIASNVDKIYMQPEWTADVYEEVIRCYRILGLKVLE